MRLNPDCVRDILLEVEEGTDYSTSITYDLSKPCPPRFRRYSHDELIYHIKQCDEAGLIEVSTRSWGGEKAVISDLTPKGHEFLANTRKNEIWEGTKVVAKKVGSVSLNALVQIASNVITELIKAQFGIGSLPPQQL